MMSLDLIILPFGPATRGRPTDWRVVFAWATAQLVLIAMGTFVFPFLWEAMIRALQVGSSRRYRPALVAAASSLFVIALTLVFVLIVTVMAPHGQVFRRADWLVVLPIALIAPIAVFLGARDTISWRRRRDGWDLPEIPA
jgi:hypothetical protein